MKLSCSYFNSGTCKSCDLIDLDYPDQIKFKINSLEKSLESLSHPPILSTVTSGISNFRNKAKFVVTGTVEDPVIGLTGSENLDQGRELLSCGLHLQEINDLLPEIKEFIKQANLKPYSIAEKRGELKGLIIFINRNSDQGYLRLILRSKESIDRLKKHLHVITDKHSILKVVSANIQPIPHAILEGEEEIILTQDKSIKQRYEKFEILIDPQAFIQTNQAVATKLYEEAANWTKEIRAKKFVELFCGQGAFTFHCSKYFSEGLGIEINPKAVERANETASKHGFNHVKFLASDAALISDEVGRIDPDIILVNPPRRGLSDSIKILLEQRPGTIIYSSCNYETLASDLVKLSSFYKMTRVQIFDMFPHTKHFETLVQLTRV